MNTLYLYSLNSEIIRYIDICNRNKIIIDNNMEKRIIKENNMNDAIVKYFSTNEYDNSKNEFMGRDGKIYGNFYGFLDMEYLNNEEYSENLNDLETSMFN